MATAWHNAHPAWRPKVRNSTGHGNTGITGHDTRLQRLRTLSNFIQDVGADAGDGHDRVDVLLLCREAEFDGSGEMILVMVKGPAHLWSSFLMGRSEE